MSAIKPIEMNMQQLAIAAFIQGALSVKGVDISGAALAAITEDAIAYVNAYLVVTTYATVYRVSFGGGVAWQQDNEFVRSARAIAKESITHA